MMGTIWDNLKDRVSTWFKACREEIYDHYTCFLPKKTGLISSFLLKQFYSGITVDADQLDTIKHVPEGSAVVYVTKKRSHFEYLFFHTRYRELNLPVPEIGFEYGIRLWQPLTGILRILISRLVFFSHRKTFPNPYEGGYFHHKVNGGTAAMFSLTGKKSFYQKFLKAKADPIRLLIEIQQSSNKPIFIIPQLIFYGKSPLRTIPSVIDILFGSEANPGIFRRLFILFSRPEKVFVEISDPVNLKSFLEERRHKSRSAEGLTLILRKRLSLQINRHHQSITGPVLKTSEELKESILTGERLRGFMEYYAKKRDIPIYRVRKKADDHLEEIMAKYSAAMIRILEVIVGWITHTMFDGVSVNRDLLARIKRISQKGPLILIPSHKSHIDYLILSYLLYQNNMPCPHIAAGKNLSFWPLGPIFRSGGAFFIRRTFKGAVLYSKVFSEYIRKLLEEGFNIEFFIEGGRSRTGKMILPKLGLLSTILTAYREGACEDLFFVPIYIGYDRVLEESAYLSELEGGKKEDENLLQIIKARKFLKKRYGKIYIRFSEPVSFRELLAQMDIQIAALTTKDQNALCRNLGHRVINAINQVTVVTPHGIVASAILNNQRKRFSFEHLSEQIETYMTHLSVQRVALAETLVIDQAGAIEKVLETYVQRKFIEQISLGPVDDTQDIVYTINESKRPNLEYYKNNCISFFIPGAFTALAILERDAFQFTSGELYPSYSFLQDFFKDEFAYDVDRVIEFFIRKNIKAFIDDAILMPHPTLPDTYNLTSIGFRKLRLFAIFLKTYFESYWVVINHFKQTPQNGIGTRERIKKIESLGNRMYKKEEIDHKEALSEVNYKNAVKFFNSRGITGKESQKKIEPFEDALRRYLSLLSP